MTRRGFKGLFWFSFNRISKAVVVFGSENQDLYVFLAVLFPNSKIFLVIEFGQHVLGVQDFDNKVLSSKGFGLEGFF